MPYSKILLPKVALILAFPKIIYYTVAMEGFYESDRDSNHRSIEFFVTDGCSPHFHAQVEILYVTKGYITVTINGLTEKVGAGGICVSGSYDVHAYSVEPGGEATALMLPLECLQKFFTYSKDCTIRRHIVYDERLSQSVVSLIALYENNRNDSNPLFDEGWVNTLLGLLYDALEFVPASVGGKNETIRSVLTYINAHYDEDLTLNGLSKQFGYNPYHFSRLFNNFMNISLKRYINSVRFEAAADKLKNGESATGAALNSGFNSMRTFYRGFTEYYGVTPQRYARLYAVGDAKSRDN